MPTTTFTSAQLQACFVNRHDPTSNAARDTFSLPSAHVLHMAITGTDANLIMTSGAGNCCSISVDGGAFATGTLSPITAGNLPLFSGLSDTTHYVDVVFRGGFTSVNTWLIASGALSVTGASPAVAADPNYGPYVLPRAGGSCRTTVTPQINGVLLSTTVPMVGGDQACHQGGMIRMRGRASRLLALTSSQKWVAVLRDGVYQTTAQAPTIAEGTTRWWTVATGLDDTVDHDWELVGGCNNSMGMYLDGMMLGGSAAAISATLPAARPARLLALGDSLTAASDGGGSDSPLGNGALGWWAVLARTLGWDALAAGRPGYKIEQYIPLAPYDIVAAQAGFGSAIDYVVIHLGRNNGADSLATVTANYTSLLNAILGVGQFSGKVVCVNVPGGGSNLSNGIIAAVAAVNNPRITLLNSAGWSIGTGTDLTHYTITGHSTLASLAYATGAFVTPSGSGGLRLPRSMQGGYSS